MQSRCERIPFSASYFRLVDQSVNRDPDVDAIDKLANSNSYRQILDVGCGSGVVARKLSARGYAVCGIDVSSCALDLANSISSTARFELRDAENSLDDLGKFDLAVSWNTSFGFVSDDRCRHMVANIRSVLSSGGGIFFDLPNIFRIIKNYQSKEWLVHENTAMLEVNTFCPLTSTTLKERLIFRDGKKTEHYDYRIRLFSPTEIRSLLESAGFSEVRIFGIDGESFGMESQRMRVFAL